MKVALKGLRLGVPRRPFWNDLEPALEQVAESALQTLRQAGVELVDIDMSALRDLNAGVGFPVALFEFLRDMRRYLEERGRGVTLEELIAAVGSPDVRGAVGTLLTGGGIPEDVYESALQARAKMQALYAQTFESHRIEALASHHAAGRGPHR